MPSYANQTTFTGDFTKGVMGQIANEEKYNAISRTVETAAGLPFGHPGFRSATAANVHNCRAFAASAAFLGIAVLTNAYQAPQPGGTAIADGYPQNGTASLMTEGQMYVIAGAAVTTAGTQVYWDNTAKAYTPTVGTNFLVPGAFFDTIGAQGSIVEISLNHRVA